MIVMDAAGVEAATMVMIVSPSVAALGVSGRRRRSLSGGGGGGGVVIIFALERVNGRFVAADGAKLIAHDSEDEEAVENGDDGQQDGMKHFGLLRLDVG